MKNKRTGGDEILTFFVDGKMPRSILVSAMTPDVVITFDGEMLSGFDKNKIKEIIMSEHGRNPKGQVQSSTLVVNPMPAKKTNVPRRGKRKPSKG